MRRRRNRICIIRRLHEDEDDNATTYEEDEYDELEYDNEYNEY